MKNSNFKIKIKGNRFYISLNKRYKEYIYSLADHLEFSLKWYDVDIFSVNKVYLTIQGVFNEDKIDSLETAVTEQFNYHFSNKEL